MGRVYSFKTNFGSIEAYVHDAMKDGPHLLFTGAIHGNEKCGTMAIERKITEIESGEVILSRGRFIAVKICNPLAFEENTRFSANGINLNRIFKRHHDADIPERAFANTIIDIIDRFVDPAKGVWPDLHSYHDRLGKPFVIVEYATERNLELARMSGVSDIFLGWNDLYANPANPGVVLEPCTIDYAHEKGMTGLTIECGGHTDHESPDVAYQTIGRIMSAYGICDSINMPPAMEPRFIQMTEIVRKPQGDWRLVKEWRNLDILYEGEKIAEHTDGTKSEIIRAPKDCLILLPFSDAAPGAEWWYYGQHINKNEVRPLV